MAYSSDFSKVQTTEMSKEFLEAYKAKYGEGGAQKLLRWPLTLI